MSDSSDTVMEDQIEDEILAYILERFANGDTTLTNLKKELMERFPNNDWSPKNAVKCMWKLDN